MFLKHKSSGVLIEVLELKNLYDPFSGEIMGRCHAGEELQDPETYAKLELIFPSGESLPRCWLDPHYHDREFTQNASAASV
ncbi:MAG TPA: acetyltransferase [Oscillatoriales cyanobacterium M59_W2019_021]|nr:MAG: acetyltransferase [Cyanobacteria bacterium J055]HIK31786.1 acetyltransferase [Oscillatoriales cyanobacterium M4454_W2019_049]HIK49828.1 acetyltransferase [Oscillatoriales cyanobacterium M59_W2019_021]